MALPPGAGEMKLSCFSAVKPVMGWNQWVKWVAPCSMAQFFMPSAISLAVSSWREVPSLRHCFQATTASQETYLAMAVSLKTLTPNRLGIFSNSS